MTHYPPANVGRAAPLPARNAGFRVAAAVFLGAVLCAGCTTVSYQSPAPSRKEVQQVRSQIESATPDRQVLTLQEATALAAPVFNSIAEDAARICRTLAEADSCRTPAFQIVDVSQVNARAGYSLSKQPEIALTRGLVEYLADQPDELALVIGHEYGHLISAHVEFKKADDGTGDSIMGAALMVLAAAASHSAGSNADVYYRPNPAPTYSRREIDEYLSNTADPRGDYRWFSRGEELEADYLGTYLATRCGYAPTGAALVELGALKERDALSPLEKQDDRVSFAYWDTHPYSPERAARVRETLEEIELLKSKGYARPLPPRLILEIQDNTAAFYTLEELVAPLP